MLVTFGITPEHPETGYGYIEAGNEIDGHPGVNAVATFTEKPDLATARAYVDGGRHFWNSGIFLFAARTYNDELATHAPEIANCCAAEIGRASCRERVCQYV